MKHPDAAMDLWVVFIFLVIAIVFSAEVIILRITQHFDPPRERCPYRYCEDVAWEVP